MLDGRAHRGSALDGVGASAGDAHCVGGAVGLHRGEGLADQGVRTSGERADDRPSRGVGVDLVLVDLERRRGGDRPDLQVDEGASASGKVLEEGAIEMVA